MNAAFVLLAVYAGSANVGHISGGGGGGDLYSPQPAFIGEAPSDFRTSARLRYISEMKNLRDRGIFLRKKDGGKLSERHRLELQNKLDAVQRSYQHSIR